MEPAAAPEFGRFDIFVGLKPRARVLDLLWEAGA